MNYGTWLALVVASVVTGVDAELIQRLAPLWRRIAERVGSFFSRRSDAPGALSAVKPPVNDTGSSRTIRNPRIGQISQPGTRSLIARRNPVIGRRP